MEKSAVISPCGKYRYRLDRRISDSPLVFAFFGVNPSKADASGEDQTTMKWAHFSQTYGAGRYIAANPMALRSTDVRMLAQSEDPVGPNNTLHIRQVIEEADILIPCWGNRTKVPANLRVHIDALSRSIANSGKNVAIFGLTKSGDPMHPLMLAHSTPLIEMDWRHDRT